MKVFIRRNATTKTGHEMAIVDENGVENIIPLDSEFYEKKSGKTWVRLPANPTNRNLWAKVDFDADQLYLEPRAYREPRILGPRTESGPRKKLEDYLTDDEKATIAAIMEKAKERREADKPAPLTPLEKARREYERKKAMYEKLLSEAEA